MKKIILTASLILLCTVGWGQNGHPVWQHVGDRASCEPTGAICTGSNDPLPATLHLPNVTIAQGIRYCDQMPGDDAGEECVQRQRASPALAKTREKDAGDMLSQYLDMFNQLRSCRQTLDQAIKIAQHPKEAIKEAQKP